MHLTLFVLALVGANPAAPAPESAESLRKKATKLYRAKSYDQACPLFEKAARLAPKDGALLADWGLCLQRWGKEKEALEVDLRALQASRGDPKTRANIYYNLSAFHDATPGQLELQELPTPSGHYVDGGGCSQIVSSEPSCSLTLYGCVSMESRDDETAFGLRIFRDQVRGEEWVRSGPVPGAPSCDPALAPSQLVRPVAGACILWGSQMEPGAPCGGDAECWKAAKAYAFPKRGECKIVYANPCDGRLGVTCWGLPFMSRKAIIKGSAEGSDTSPELVGEVNPGPPEPSAP